MMHWSELEVFKRAHQLVLEIYRLTENYPKSELFGLISQLRRSSYSVAVNIVEGKSRKRTRELIQFLNIANASLEEVRYFLLLSKDLKYIDEEKYMNLESECETINKMLNSFILALNKKVSKKVRDGER